MNNNKKTLLAAAILLLALIVLIAFRLLTPEDTWLCKNGQWVKHGNPSAGMPAGRCE